MLTFDYQYGEDGVWFNIVRVGSLRRRRRDFRAADWWIEPSGDKESEGGRLTKIGDELGGEKRRRGQLKNRFRDEVEKRGTRLTSIRPPCKRVSSLQTKRPRPDPPTAVCTSAVKGKDGRASALLEGEEKARERTIPLLESLEKMPLILERHSSSRVLDLDKDVSIVTSVDELLSERSVEHRRIESWIGFGSGRSDERYVDGDLDELRC